MSNLEERFWSKVHRLGPDKCWEWTGASDGRGYGQIYHEGRNRKATHISYMLATCDTIHDIPAALMICHSCDNPGCVNPAHLWLGTMSENIKDAVAKGRHKPGGWYRRPTHCKRGHALDEANTKITSHGSRSCRICQRMHDQNWRDKNRAALQSKGE